MTLSIRPVLAAALAAATVAGAVALTTADASAAPYKSKPAAHGIAVGQAGAFASKCQKKRIFFENCNWMQVTCAGRVVRFDKLNCPDLR